jgi:heme oxygenase
MLQKLIKEATQDMHSSLEHVMHVEEIMNGGLTHQQYKRMLVINYLVAAEYEPQLIACIDSATAIRLRLLQRIKLEALLKDLQEVAINPADLKKEAGFIIDSKNALGCLYVLEGATLGGNVIVGKLKNNKHLEPYHLQYHYYQVYGDQLIPNWKQLCEVINEQPEHDYANIIEGAIDMFAAIITLAGQA